jgi:hypothetical protein
MPQQVHLNGRREEYALSTQFLYKKAALETRIKVSIGRSASSGRSRSHNMRGSSGIPDSRPVLICVEKPGIVLKHGANTGTSPHPDSNHFVPSKSAHSIVPPTLETSGSIDAPMQSLRSLSEYGPALINSTCLVVAIDSCQPYAEEG